MFNESPLEGDGGAPVFFIEEDSLFSELSKLSEEVLRKLKRVYQLSFVSSLSKEKESLTFSSLSKLFGEGESPLIPDKSDCDAFLRFLVLEKECQDVLKILHQI